VIFKQFIGDSKMGRFHESQLENKF